MRFSTYPLTSMRGDSFQMSFCDKAIVHQWWLGVLQYLAVLEEKTSKQLLSLFPLGLVDVWSAVRSAACKLC